MSVTNVASYAIHLLNYLLYAVEPPFNDTVLPWLLAHTFQVEFIIYRIAFIDKKYQCHSVSYRSLDDLEKDLPKIEVLCVNSNWYAQIRETSLNEMRRLQREFNKINKASYARDFMKLTEISTAYLSNIISYFSK